MWHIRQFSSSAAKLTEVMPEKHIAATSRVMYQDRVLNIFYLRLDFRMKKKSILYIKLLNACQEKIYFIDVSILHLAIGECCVSNLYIDLAAIFMVIIFILNISPILNVIGS